MKKILIVEDDISIAELERDYLEINGYEVRIVNNGIDGAQEGLAGDYDLIIIDLMLPGKDGFSICREIREQKEIPLLLVTAKKEDIDKIRGLGIGADDYIVKPFSPSELVARVGAHISRYERLLSSGAENNSKAQGNIVVGGLEIHPDAWRVYVEGEEVKLANKEFELLLFLSENPNKVFSKEALFEKIWGYDALGDASTVTVHINRIREKTEANGTQYIETVWGAGYRFRHK